MKQQQTTRVYFNRVEHGRRLGASTLQTLEPGVPSSKEASPPLPLEALAAYESNQKHSVQIEKYRQHGIA
jgi:hypothetical protein